MDNLILGIGRLLPDMTFNVTRPNGTKLNALVEVTLDRVLKAVLIFKGLMIEWVVVKGFAEESVSTDGVVDVWSDSRYKVFRKITENANAAMLNFQSPVYPEVAIKSFMVRFVCALSLFFFVRKMFSFRLTCIVSSTSSRTNAKSAVVTSTITSRRHGESLKHWNRSMRIAGLELSGIGGVQFLDLSGKK